MGVSARLRINGSFSAAERKKSSSAVCGPLRRRVPTTHTRRTGSHSNSELNLDISHTRTTNIRTTSNHPSKRGFAKRLTPLGA